jgi:hypothetical protein
MIEAHQITSDWNETEMTWDDRQSAVPWTTPGGDFDTRIISQVSHDSDAAPDWRYFDVTELATGWVQGTIPNYGVMLKMPDIVENTIVHLEEFQAVNDNTDDTYDPFIRIT